MKGRHEITGKSKNIYNYFRKTIKNVRLLLKSGIYLNRTAKIEITKNRLLSFTNCILCVFFFHR